MKQENLFIDPITLSKSSISRSLWRRYFLFAALVLVWFALSPFARAADGGLGNGNTAEGDNALNSLTSGAANTAIGESALLSDNTGFANTASGFEALERNTTGFNNTAMGVQALSVNNGHDNTANGFNALLRNTGGRNNTAVGSEALFGNTSGINNTATGWQALMNSNSNNNTATGVQALQSDTSGNYNTATGVDALHKNTAGSMNTANGVAALEHNVQGSFNTATGFQALAGNNGLQNSATGYRALLNNTSGDQNTADGAGSLSTNTIGNSNTAIGFQALSSNTTGIGNIALGLFAGNNLTTGNDNIDIGSQGAAGESNTIHIGTQGVQTATFVGGIRGVPITGSTVVVNANGQLGVATSSARFKEAIKPMDKQSEAILALKPVTFRYKKAIDPEGSPQFGLVAEEVEKVNPDLVVRDAEGKIYTVRYEAVNAMLLNEFLKEHQIVQKQQATIGELKSTAAQQERELKAFAVKLEAQAAQIQKVSAEIETTKSAPQMVVNNR